MYKRILVPVDLQEEDERLRNLALQRAVELCRFYNARLHVLTVVPDMGMPLVGSYFPEDAGRQIVQEAEKLLHEQVTSHLPDDLDIQHIVAQGTVYRRILKTAQQLGVDLIVMPAHRMTLKEYFLGSNASRVVRFAECSVLVLRPEFDADIICVS